MVTLYPLIGFRGLALAFTLSTYLQIGYYLWQTCKLLNKKIADLIPLKAIGIMFVISIVSSYLVFKFTTSANNIFNLIVCGIVCLLSIILFYYFNFKTEKVVNQ